MHPIVAWLRRHALLLVLAGFTAHFAYAAWTNSARLTAVCEAFATADGLLGRAAPEDSPWKVQIDENRQAIALLCETHRSEASYPEKPEYR